jgi:hypothetical protein
VQSIINAGFGALVATGLFWIGVPYAALWGVVVALLRFIPYVGAPVAMVMPLALAFVQFDGWGHTLATGGLFVGLEAVTANVVEPVLIGHHTGVSSFALLVTALFWVWLWGPIGLVLSTPLTVCLAVLGKHVRQLEFLAVLLGDEEALGPSVSFYQRLLARDEDEASEIVERQLQTTSRDRVFDEILVPALLFAGHDRARDEILEAAHQFILQATGEIIENVAEAEREGEQKEDTPAVSGNDVPRAQILGVPMRDMGDELVLRMLGHLLDSRTCELRQFSTATLTSEVLVAIEERAPDLVCITALPPGGVNHVRHLCKRLRARFPDARVLVLRPGAGADTGPAGQRMKGEGADAVEPTLTAAVAEVNRLLLPGRVRPAAEPSAQLGHAREAATLA